MGKQDHAISPTRQENYPEWYQQVIKAADLAETSPVRGCMVIKPWGWGIWERIQKSLDQMVRDTGHENAYFPLFIPVSFLEQEAKHVEGFAKECAVVTHHRLQPGPEGKLVPAGELEEPLIVRPTSETIIGAMFAKWVQSWRDLPILINQWANVVRWELRTRLFLRTTEFLWQEGHTVHATAEEAIAETEQMLAIYRRFAEEWMAAPVIPCEKTAAERFPGAVSTYSIEAMMQDRKALQAGTSHYLGQNFSKAQEIRFQDRDGQLQYAWTTSWGVSTRLIGCLIMTHSDDDGLVLPPRLAPQQVVIQPIYRNDDERASVMDYVARLKQQLEPRQSLGEPVRVRVDDRDLRGGEKTWQNIKKGVPLRVEIGPRDVTSGSVVFTRRTDPRAKNSAPLDEFVSKAPGLLEEMQSALFQRALGFREANTHRITSLDDFRELFSSSDEETSTQGGFAWCHWTEDPAMYNVLDELRVTIRGVPLDQSAEPGTCIFTGKPSQQIAIFARAY